MPYTMAQAAGLGLPVAGAANYAQANETKIKSAVPTSNLPSTPATQSLAALPVQVLNSVGGVQPTQQAATLSSLYSSAAPKAASAPSPSAPSPSAVHQSPSVPIQVKPPVPVQIPKGTVYTTAQAKELNVNIGQTGGAPSSSGYGGTIMSQVQALGLPPGFTGNIPPAVMKSYFPSKVSPSSRYDIIPGRLSSSAIPTQLSSPYIPKKYSDNGGKTWYIPGSPEDPTVKRQDSSTTLMSKFYEPREVTINQNTGKVIVPKNATKEQGVEAANLAARIAAEKLRYEGGLDRTYNMKSPQTINYKGTTIIFDKAAYVNPDAIKFELDKLPPYQFSLANESAGGRPSLVVVGGSNPAELAAGIAGLNQGNTIFVADRQGVAPGSSEGGTPQMTMFALAHEIGHSVAYSKTKHDLETLFDQQPEAEKQRYIRVWGDNYGGNTSSSMKSGLGGEVFATNFANKYPKDLPMFVVPTKVPANISMKDAVGMADLVAKEANLRYSSPDYWNQLGAKSMRPINSTYGGPTLNPSGGGPNFTFIPLSQPTSNSTIRTAAPIVASKVSLAATPKLLSNIRLPNVMSGRTKTGLSLGRLFSKPPPFRF